MKIKKYGSGSAIIACIFLFLNSSVFGQNIASFLTPSDTLNKKRFRISAGIGTAIYSGFSVGLWNSWYKDYPLTNFHLFDDMGEWNQMDKSGHLITAYIESHYLFTGALWTGMDRKSAMWSAAGIATGLQLTVEVMDGFSEKWGFSLGDFAFNTLGIGIFVGQELLWQEQRILMKISSNQFDHTDDPVYSLNDQFQTTLNKRANSLFGTSYLETFLKDYNEQKNWASINIWSFLPYREQSSFPKWLNVGIGYGVGNIYGGFKNRWTENESITYQLSKVDYPRYRQILLGFDVDLRKIKTKKAVIRTLLHCLNWIKIPSPALEYNTKGEFIFHPLYW